MGDQILQLHSACYCNSPGLDCNPSLKATLSTCDCFFFVVFLVFFFFTRNSKPTIRKPPVWREKQLSDKAVRRENVQFSQRKKKKILFCIASHIQETQVSLFKSKEQYSIFFWEKHIYKHEYNKLQKQKNPVSASGHLNSIMILLKQSLAATSSIKHQHYTHAHTYTK